MTRHFVELTAGAALRAAIAVEQRNAEIYRNLAQTFAAYDTKLGEIFRLMAGEEDVHRVKLEAFLREQFPEEARAGRAAPEIREVLEAPDLQDAEVFIFDNLTVEAAIARAEQAERAAFEFYQSAARQVTHAGLRKLCEHMAQEEREHQNTFARWRQHGVPPQMSSKPCGGDS